MRIFIDTEFSDLNSPRLISVGLVREDQDAWFYGELLADGWQQYASDFVLAEVVPLLEQPLGQETPAQIAERIRRWAESLPEQAQVACDSDYDWNLLRGLMLDNGGWPQQFAEQPLRVTWTPKMGELLEVYFLRNRRKRHHALHDAEAFKFGCLELERLMAEAAAATKTGPSVHR